MSKLIVLEGSDGSGKATQTTRLYERLQNLGINVLRVSFRIFGIGENVPARRFRSNGGGSKSLCGGNFLRCGSFCQFSAVEKVLHIERRYFGGQIRRLEHGASIRKNQTQG